jgi:hypothetical protein
MGLPAFHQALGLPLQLYAPYFCDDTTYDKVNGGNWSFLPGTCGGGFKVKAVFLKPPQILSVERASVFVGRTWPCFCRCRFHPPRSSSTPGFSGRVWRKVWWPSSPTS